MAGKDQLTAEQTLFAEWLASPPLERGTQKDIATKLGVEPRTLRRWEKLPEIHLLVYKLFADNLIALVGPATQLIEKAIKHPGSVSRVSYDAAKYIVSDWGKQYQQEDVVIKSIRDMYKRYNPNA